MSAIMAEFLDIKGRFLYLLEKFDALTADELIEVDELSDRYCGLRNYLRSTGELKDSLGSVAVW